MSDVFREVEAKLDESKWITFGPTIRVHHTWFDHPALLASRLQAIVVGSHNYEPTFNETTSSWQLDNGNDWWVTIDPDGKVIQIRHRYGFRQDFWSALKMLIENLPDTKAVRTE